MNGWTLEDMDWDPVTGVAILEYSNADGTEGRRAVSQPAHESHVRWVELGYLSQGVLTLR